MAKHKKKRSTTSAFILLLTVSINALLLLILAYVIVGKLQDIKKQEEGAKRKESHVNQVNITDRDYGSIWIPNYKDLRKSRFDLQCVQDENGIKKYVSGTIESACGVDVCEWQEDIDWDQVAAQGIDFAMIRVVWRGYETGELHEDALYKEHIEGALKAGLKVGAYAFSQATTPQEAKEEAQLLLKCIEPYDVTFPIAYDWELVQNENSRIADLDGETLTACARAFCDEVKEKNYIPMLYLYKDLAYFRYDISKLSDCQLWLSRPSDDPDLFYPFAMWQYATKTKIEGIPGNADLNLYLYRNY